MIQDIKVGVVMPTRGTERIEFVRNAIKLMSRQTVKIEKVEVIGDDPASEACDITYRYRVGYERMTDVDVVFFWEDDDWYADDYIETMLLAWNAHKRPDLFGTKYTYYYHLKICRYFTMRHEARSSMMSTMMKANLKGINWGKDSNPYTDTWLWDVSWRGSKALFAPSKIISVGMKHNIGKTGGLMHDNRDGAFRMYLNDDANMDWLRSLADPDTMEFYKKINHQLNQ